MVRKAVTLIECPRDAWQGLRRQIPTELKTRYLRALIDAGFKHIDAVSFVSPKAVPQMADSEKVLEQIDVPDDVEIIGIVVNEKGAERAIATRAVSTLGFPCSISENLSAQKPESVAGRMLQSFGIDQKKSRRRWAKNCRLHFDGIWKPVWRSVGSDERSRGAQQTYQSRYTIRFAC